MTKARRVYIFWPETMSYGAMFKEEGWEITANIHDADLVLLTGGEDVDPSLYRQSKHPLTDCNFERDEAEEAVFNMARELAIPMAGICRGGQFLNVMNLGTLWQHVNNHNIAHNATVTGINKIVTVSSVHHQQMRPPSFGDYLVLLEASESTKKEDVVNNHIRTRIVTDTNPDADIEAIYYPTTNCLCFQPHPEYKGYDETKKLFFWFVNNYCLQKEPPNTLQNTDDAPF